MARRYYSSTAARTTLATGVDDTTTTLSVTAVSGWPTSFPYTLIIDADTVNEEIVEVSARSGTTLTVTRGVDGTSAVAHSSGAAVQHGVSARDFDEPNAFINGTGTVTETLLATGAVTSTKILDGTIVNADINASAAIAQSKIDSLTSDLASKVDYATPSNDQTGTTYTFVGDDAFRLTTSDSASAVTFTIPAASAVAWGDDTILRVVNYGAGAVTVDGGSGVTVTNTATTIAQYQAAAAIRTGSDAWTLVPFAGGGEVPAATISSPAATGQYSSGGFTYDYYTFTSSSTLTVDSAGFADVLVVGAGGGGASAYNGAGAGGHLVVTDAYLPSGTLTVTVGAGGAGGVAGGSIFGGRSGNASRLDSYYGVSGGGAGDGSALVSGHAGGSGGGGSGAGITGQGNDGGARSTFAGAGGGGASAAGGANSGNNGGAGGAGLANSFTGSSVTRAGGGGGGVQSGNTAGSGGSGGGGNGSSSTVGGAGTANTGGGGGGGAYASGTHQGGGSGGSGVVIVRVKV